MHRSKFFGFCNGLICRYTDFSQFCYLVRTTVKIEIKNIDAKLNFRLSVD